MSAEERWHALISGEAHGPGAALQRGLLTALAGPYWFGLRSNLAVYDWGLKRASQAVLPVISVGNLSLGGTGKSTAVRYLARELQRRGVRPGVVLRGHRRAAGPEVLLASDGRGAVAPLEQTGDEAAEVARALPDVPVGVGKRREEVIALLRSSGAQVALLDDGYQYFRMARDLNIALVSARMDLRTARLFPRGTLREPWGHLRRADQVWITHADHVTGTQLDALRGLIGRYAPGRPVLVTCHRPAALATLSGQPVELASLAGQKVLAVSGLGCPESFEYTLVGLGAQPLPLRYDDHYRYSPDDWEHIRASAAREGAAAVVTTEKDAVKLPPDAPLPVWVLRSEMQVLEGEAAVAAAVDRIVSLVSEALA